MLFQFPHNQARQGVDAVHAKDQIHIGVALAQFFHHMLLIGHAAAQADDEAGLFLFQPLEGAHVAENPLFCVFPHGAGVEEDQVCVFRFIAQTVPDVYQHAFDPLAVVDILLAAVAVDVSQRRGIIKTADDSRRLGVVFVCYIFQK